MLLTHIKAYGGSSPAITTTGYSIPSNNTLDADSGWDQDAEGVNFGASGVVTASLANGTNYGDKTDYTTVGALAHQVLMINQWLRIICKHRGSCVDHYDGCALIQKSSHRH